MAFAHAGCRWVTATARSTTPTLTNNRIPVSPSTDDPRTAIPFSRRRMRCPASASSDGPGRRWLAREDTPNGTPDSQGNALSETHASVTPYTCETEIPFGRQMSGGSDNAMSSERANVFDTA